MVVSGIGVHRLVLPCPNTSGVGFTVTLSRIVAPMFPTLRVFVRLWQEATFPRKPDTTSVTINNGFSKIPSVTVLPIQLLNTRLQNMHACAVGLEF